jgi:hypothetical protein
MNPAGLLPRMSLTEPRIAWSRFLLDAENMPATYIVAGIHQDPSALLLPYPAAARAALEMGQPDVPTFRLENALDVLPDLVYRATRLQCATAITHQGTALAAVVPLVWANVLPEHGITITERTAQ